MSMIRQIGNTPLIKVDGIWCKCEQFNPTGSIKDRVAYEMLTNTKSNKIVEVSSGNTGISVAFVGSVLNKHVTVFVPRYTSRRKIDLIKLYGADVKLCKSIARGQTLAKKYANNGYDYVDQFSNKYNIVAQDKMVKEIKYPNPVLVSTRNFDAIVSGIGTGGTITALHRAYPNTPLFSYQLALEGTSDGVPLPLMPKLNVTRYNINPLQVNGTRQFLAWFKGIDVGFTSAANYLVASKVKEEYDKVLIIFHDAGWHYA